MKFLDWELLGWGRGQVRDWVLPASSVPDTVEADFASQREVCGCEKKLLGKQTMPGDLGVLF